MRYRPTVKVFRRAGLAASAVAMVLLFNACGSTFTVTVDATGFSPTRVRTNDQQDAIQWHNTDSSGTHTATSEGNGAFFDTGDIPPDGTSSPIAFQFAGLFHYHDKYHPKHSATAYIPLCVQSEASPGDHIFVQWAGCPTGTTIPAGFHADIQVRLPGNVHYANWLMNQTGSQTGHTYHVKRKGIYRFRARYVKNGVERSDYTPAAVCNVT